MSRWTPTDLDAIGNAAELHVAPWAGGATPRRPATVWVVRVGDDLFVRSYRGQGGVWYRTAQRSHRGRIRAGGVERDVTFEEAADADSRRVDDAYRAKYGRSGYVNAMVTTAAAETTLRLVPADRKGEPSDE